MAKKKKKTHSRELQQNIQSNHLPEEKRKKQREQKCGNKYNMVRKQYKKKEPANRGHPQNI